MNEQSKITVTSNGNSKCGLWELMIINNNSNTIGNNNEIKYMFKSLYNNKYLTINQNSYQLMCSSIMNNNSQYFIISNVIAKSFKNFNRIANSFSNIAIKRLSTNNTPFKGRNLTKDELLFFKKYGYIVIKNAIPKNVIFNALRFINQGISTGKHCQGLGSFGLWTNRNKNIIDLYYQSHIYSIIKSLIGNDNDVIIPGCQIALRFPTNIDLTRKVTKNTLLPKDRWHIDGMRFGNNIGIGKFTVLIGFVLSNWNENYVGNFTVFPREHYKISNELKQYGVNEFLNKVKTGKNMTPFKVNNEAKQIIGNIGDVIICHPYLPHRAGPNLSENIRYAVFMRPTRMDHKSNEMDMINSNMFCEFNGNNIFKNDKIIQNIKQKPVINSSKSTSIIQKRVNNIHHKISIKQSKSNTNVTSNKNDTNAFRVSV